MYVQSYQADVAKWLRHWVVIPTFAGSSPVIRPHFRFYFHRNFYTMKIIYTLL